MTNATRTRFKDTDAGRKVMELAYTDYRAINALGMMLVNASKRAPQEPLIVRSRAARLLSDLASKGDDPITMLSQAELFFAAVNGDMFAKRVGNVALRTLKRDEQPYPVRETAEHLLNLDSRERDKMIEAIRVDRINSLDLRHTLRSMLLPPD